jgi:hypothetical protein
MKSKSFYSVLLLFPSLLLASATSFSEYILSPSSRTIAPKTIHSTNGKVKNAKGLLSSGAATFSGKNSSVTVDFGKNIAGRVSFNADSLGGLDQLIGFTFTESALWISSEYCDATQDVGLDQPLLFNISSKGFYTAPKQRQRGAFRYMTIVSNSTSRISISNVTIGFTAEPSMPDPSVYTGYFHSDNEKLNRVWYAGVYTNQLCTIDPTEGSALNQPTYEWYYNTTIAEGTSVLVDGAKRDRLVWPGDIAVSGPSIYVSTGSYNATKNGLDQLLSMQQYNGQLPYVGTPFEYQISAAAGFFIWSFTYHLHTLIDIYDYYTFTGDKEYLKKVWGQFKLAMAYSLSTVDSTKLAYVTSSADWLRDGMGGHNIEVRMARKPSIVLNRQLIPLPGQLYSLLHSWSRLATSI